MFEEVIEALREEAERLDRYAADAIARSQAASAEAANQTRRADEKRLAIQILRLAKVDYGTELINRGNAPDPE